ncbi:MAG: hypothetical protein OES69_13525, partial [Myxococcales bacterium]|nr:hypothetical protein [Myxococcales bacterium]
PRAQAHILHRLDAGDKGGADGGLSHLRTCPLSVETQRARDGVPSHACDSRAMSKVGLDHR